MRVTQVAMNERQPLIDIAEVEPLCEGDEQLFSEMHDVLKRHGALQRFGITLLHQHFEIADDEVLLERTDKEKRRQLIEPVKVSELVGKEAIQTSWRLDTGKPVMSCVCVVLDRLGRHEHFHRG